MELNIFFASLSLLAAGVLIVIGGLVLHLNPRAQLNRVFFTLCLSIAILAFVEFQYRSADSMSAAQPWIKLASFWYLTAALILHFALIFTGRGNLMRRWLALAFLYLPVIALLLLDLNTDLLTSEPVLKPWGWTYESVESVLSYSVQIYISLLALLAIVLCLIHFLKARPGNRRRQAGFVLAGLLFPVVSGIFGELVVPMYGIRVPEFTTLSSALGMASFIGFAIWRYELFRVTPAGAAEDILSIMSDGIFIISPLYDILYVNRSALEMVGYKEQDMLHRDFFELFPSTEDFRSALVQSGLPRGKGEGSVTAVETVLTRSDGAPVPVSASVSPLVSNAEELQGYVYAVRDISKRKASERRLKLSENRFRNLMHQSPLCTMIFNPDGSLIDFNPAVSELWGLDQDQADRLRARYNILEDRQLEKLGIMDNIREGFKGRPTEVPAIMYDPAATEITRSFPRRRLWVRSHIYPILDDGGQVIEVALVHENIMAQIAAENELKSLMAQRNALIENLQSGILFEDNERRIKYANDALTRMFGIEASPDELIDMDGSGAAEDLSGIFVHPDLFSNGIAALVEGKRPVLNEELDLLDGRTFQRDYIPVFVGEKQLGHLWHYRDISEQMSIQHQLRDERNYLDRLQNALGDAVFVVRMPERIIDAVNEAITQILGYRPEELISRHTEILYASHEEYQAFGEIIDEGISGHKEVIHSPLNLKSREGTVVPCEVTVSFLRGEDGAITQVIGVLRDVSDRIESEEQLSKAMIELERSNKDLEQFAYAVSHDLQEPLRMVSSYVELLSRRYEGRLDSDADDFIGYATDGAARMKSMIEDLLAYSRVGTRGEPFASVEAESALESALANLHNLIEENGATITHSILPHVDADESQLVQLFQNLIGNAIKFRGGPPPAIHVASVKQDGFYLFSVRDNGIGIDSSHQEQVFQVFQRLHNRDKYPGTGIGLAICKRVIERHGGRIWVKSKPGKGSTFYFTLPASDDDRKKASSYKATGNTEEVVKNHVC